MNNILIIGGNSGIGLETLKLLNNNGNNLFVASRKKPEVNFDFTYMQLDVESQKINADFLPETLDGLVYFPGTINLKPFNRITKDDFLKEMQINLFGLIDVIQTALPNLKKSKHSSVVAFSTVAVKMGMPFHASIAASKGALEGLCKSLAAEYAPTIRFNAIAPSLTNTPLAEKLISTPEKIEASAKRHPLNKIGNPTEIATLVDFLLSKNSSFISGQVIMADGGISSIKLI
jgi:NAD(P)-dependent dehydrogenase (short-subunit alcohol dehydrogenase family)